MSIAERSINSAAWNAVANVIKLPIGLIHSILLARLLPVEYFGIYGGIMALITIINPFFELGLPGAFLHRTEETKDEQQALAVLFSLRFISYSLQTILLLIIAKTYFSDTRQMVLIVVTVTGYLTRLLGTPRLLLIRRIHHRRLAILDLSGSILTAVFAILVACLTGSIWALLVSSIVGLFWTVVTLYVWRPVWRPRFSWDLPTIRYYLSFGGRVQVADVISVALDNVDDLWTNFFLGDLAMGFYSKAYKFATYPRTILAMPIQKVSTGTYAELRDDRTGLSKAFFRTTAFLIRTGFLLAGWLALIAPEFIVLFLGEKWLPMLDAFRLMMVFSLIDPIKGVIGGVLLALGMPQKVIRVRSFQLIILFMGLFTLGNRFGIAGVALAVDIMLVAGISLYLYILKTHIDFSLRRLFFAPVIAISLAFGGTLLLMGIWSPQHSLWVMGLIKSVSFIGVFMSVLYFVEGQVLYDSFKDMVDASAFFVNIKMFFRGIFDQN